MMLSIPSGIDLRGHPERMAGIHAVRKARAAVKYMRESRVVMFFVNGGTL
jgi:hypothetical protein